MNRRFVAASTLTVLLLGCSRSSPDVAAQPTDPPSSAPVGAVGWAADVDSFTAQLEAIHPEPYHSLTREAFMAEAAAYKRALPGLTELEALTGFQRLLGLLTQKGRDGHMLLAPETQEGRPWLMLPIQLYWFPDGFYVVAARDRPRLVGARLTKVGSTSVAGAVKAVRPLVTKDNAMTTKARVPAFFESPTLLVGLGLIGDRGPVLTFVEGGKTTVLNRDAAIPVEDHTQWRDFVHPYVRRLPERPGALFLRNQDENVWVRYVERSATAYVGFNLILPPFEPAVDKIRAIMEKRQPERVVVDLRNNPGGETGTYGPLLAALTAPGMDPPRGLYVLTSRVTFSAAANFLGALDKRRCVSIVGEPPGAAPRFWNDNDPVSLPYSGYEVGVSTRWWDEAGPRHEGTLFEVDVPVPYGSRDYFAGHDPVLAASIEEEQSRCS